MTRGQQRLRELKDPIAFIGQKVPSSCSAHTGKKKEKITGLLLAVGVQSASFQVLCDCGVRGERQVGAHYYSIGYGSKNKKEARTMARDTVKTKKLIEKIFRNNPREQIAKKQIKIWADVLERSRWGVPITKKDILVMSSAVRERFKKYNSRRLSFSS